MSQPENGHGSEMARVRKTASLEQVAILPHRLWAKVVH